MSLPEAPLALRLPPALLLSVFLLLASPAALAATGSEPDGAAAATVAAAAESESASATASEEDQPPPESAPQEGDEEVPADGDEQASLDERLDALLAEGAEAEVYGEQENCLYRRKYRNIDVVSEDILIFSRGKNYWINRLKRSCTGLRRNMVLHTATHGLNSLCSNDLVYANRSMDIDEGFTRSGRPLMVRASCVLGPFQSIPEPYAQALMGLEQ